MQPDAKEKEMLLNGTPFYHKERDTFCLGTTIEEASKICEQIIAEQGDKDDDNTGNDDNL